MTKTKKKKIAIFCGYYLPHLGGVERYVDKLSAALMLLGYEIVIVTSNHDNLPTKSFEKGLRIYRLPVYSIAKERYPLPRLNSYYQKIIKQIKQEDCDYYIVNTRFHLTSLIGARIAKKTNKPVLLIEHGTGHFTVGSPILDWLGKIYEHALSRFLSRYIDSYYGVSKACNSWLTHFSLKASGVFYNAIDPADGSRKPTEITMEKSNDDFIITYAGRLIKEKGVLNLVEAYKNALSGRDFTNVKLIIAGDGELYQQLKNEQTNFPEIELPGRLNFEEIMNLYDRSSVFVYPSLYPEGLPTSILEAGLMKNAIIATPKGGTEEVIVDDLHGIIVDGSTASLESAILYLLDNKNARQTMANNVHERIIKNFTWNKVASDIDTTLKGCDKNHD